MGFLYQRAGTQCLLMVVQGSEVELSAMNHKGEPGNLRRGQQEELRRTSGWLDTHAAITQRVI